MADCLHDLECALTLSFVAAVEGREAAEAAEALKAEEASHADKPVIKTRVPVPVSFWMQAWAILKAKKWQVYQGHVSTQVALGGSNFVYFFW